MDTNNRTCPSCGMAVQPEDAFCSVCGTKVPETPTAPEITPASTSWQPPAPDLGSVPTPMMGSTVEPAAPAEPAQAAEPAQPVAGYDMGSIPPAETDFSAPASSGYGTETGGYAPQSDTTVAQPADAGTVPPAYGESYSAPQQTGYGAPAAPGYGSTPAPGYGTTPGSQPYGTQPEGQTYTAAGVGGYTQPGYSDPGQAAGYGQPTAYGQPTGYGTSPAAGGDAYGTQPGGYAPGGYTAPTAVAEPPKKSKAPIIVIIAIILVLAIAGGVIFFLFSGSRGFNIETYRSSLEWDGQISYMEEDGTRYYSFNATNTSNKTITYFETWVFYYDAQGNPILDQYDENWNTASDNTSTLRPGSSHTPRDNGYWRMYMPEAELMYIFVNYVEYSDGTWEGISSRQEDEFTNVELREAMDIINARADRWARS